MSNIQFTVFQTITIGIFGFFFGIFEFSTNCYYLLKRDLRLPKIQHGRELPEEVTDSMLYRKIIQMLILGTLLLCISFVSILIAPQFFPIAGVLIFLSGLLDYSRYHKTDYFTIWIVIAFLCLITGFF